MPPKLKEPPVETDSLTALRQHVAELRERTATDAAALAAADLKHRETGSEADGTAWQALRQRVDEDRGELLPLERRLAAMEAAALAATRQPFLDGAQQKADAFTADVAGVQDAIGMLRERLISARDRYEGIGRDLLSGAHPLAAEIAEDDGRELCLVVLGMLREVFPGLMKTTERGMTVESLDRLVSRVRSIVGKGA